MVLILQKNIQDSAFIVESLREDFSVAIAVSAQDACAMLASDRVELAILSCNPEDAAELDFYRRCRGILETAKMPTILLITTVDPALELELWQPMLIDILFLPVDAEILRLKINRHVSLFSHINELRKNIEAQAQALQEAQKQLARLKKNIWLTEICSGVYWLEIPEAELSILCGCPPEIVKHMMLRGYIRKTVMLEKGDEGGERFFESGANAILLSELNTQKGLPANATEFPILQMLYRQGMLLPNHPNNTGQKPILIGTAESVDSQFSYINRGNYGLLTLRELEEAGIGERTAKILMDMKCYFAFGELKAPSSYLAGVKTNGREPVPIKNGVSVCHVGLNHFRFHYQGEMVDVDLNLSRHQKYPAPYTLDYRSVERHNFAILHTGEGDGWDCHRPSMSSVIIWHGGIYLVDAPPNIMQILRVLGIDVNEVIGVFGTHGHDDHFLGLCSLTMANRRIRYYATPLVQQAVSKKFEALFQGSKMGQYFNCIDLSLDTWNDINGLRVKPIFSPHPVENNVFIFEGRARNGIRYRYGHWADLPSFANLDKMEDLQIFTSEFVQKMKKDFLTPVNVKKIDIGGGMIHGFAEDYSTDTSAKIALAHTSNELTNREKQIGSTARFGSMDIFIPADTDYYRELAEQCIMRLFPYLDEEIWSDFYDYPVETINAGTIILKDEEKIYEVGILLTGTAEWVYADQNRELVYGDLIGEDIFAGHMRSVGTWRALSDVRIMKVPVLDFILLFPEHSVQNRVLEYFPIIQMMRQNVIFRDRIGLAHLFRLVELAQRIDISSGERRTVHIEGGVLCMIEGRGSVAKTGQTYAAGDYILGEELEIYGDSPQGCIVFHFSSELLRDIPIVQWRLREKREHDRRRSWHQHPSTAFDLVQKPYCSDGI